MVDFKIALTANKIVDDIIKDLSDRRGLKGEWQRIDDDIQREIKRNWISIIYQHIKMGA